MILYSYGLSNNVKKLIFDKKKIITFFQWIFCQLFLKFCNTVRIISFFCVGNGVIFRRRQRLGECESHWLVLFAGRGGVEASTELVAHDWIEAILFLVTVGRGGRASRVDGNRVSHGWAKPGAKREARAGNGDKTYRSGHIGPMASRSAAAAPVGARISVSWTVSAPM